MNKQTRPFIIVAFLLVFIVSSKTQDSLKFQQKIGASYLSEHINLPFKKRLGEVNHFGVSISMHWSKPRAGKYQFGQNVNMAYLYHKVFFRAVFASYEPTYSWLFWNFLQVDLPIGVGYAHSLPVEQGYVHKNGKYQKHKIIGKSHFMPSIGLGFTIPLYKILSAPIDLCFHYKLFSFFPYAPKGSLPFTPHTSINFGLKYTLK